MSLQSDIAAIQPVKPFTGGVRSVRDHQNEEVDAINAIIDAAKNNPDAAGAPGQTLVMTILANGTPVDVVFTAYVAPQ